MDEIAREQNALQLSMKAQNCTSVNEQKHKGQHFNVWVQSILPSGREKQTFQSAN